MEFMRLVFIACEPMTFLPSLCPGDTWLSILGHEKTGEVNRYMNFGDCDGMLFGSRGKRFFIRSRRVNYVGTDQPKFFHLLKLYELD